MEALLTKKNEKAITIGESGKVRIKLRELEYYELQSVVMECLDYFTNLNWKQLTVSTFEVRAAVALFYDLSLRLENSKVKLTLSRSEAELFWGWVNMADPHTGYQPSFRALLGKLHQKLS